jgi:hypothetical protein
MAVAIDLDASLFMASRLVRSVVDPISAAEFTPCGLENFGLKYFCLKYFLTKAQEIDYKRHQI